MNNAIKKSKKRLIMSGETFYQLDKIGKEFECRICECTEAEMSTKLEKCDHTFHSECLAEYIKCMLGELKTSIVCPDYECGCEMSLQDIMFHTSKEDFEIYNTKLLNRLVDTTEELKWCLTPDCGYAFDNTEMPEGKLCCPKCYKDWCLVCEREWTKGHEDLYDCKRLRAETPEEKEFYEWAQQQRTRQCPYCKMLCRRSNGCDLITCFCSNYFCYKCGSKCEKAYECPNRCMWEITGGPQPEAHHLANLPADANDHVEDEYDDEY